MLRVYPGRTATPRISDFFEKRGGATSWSFNETRGRRGDDHLCPRSAAVTDINMRPMAKWCQE
jgi:hypothetical protein